MNPRPRSREQAEAVLARHLPMLRGYLCHLLSSAVDADDVAQDLCVEVLRTPGILFRADNLAAYLRGIARHLASRHLGRERRAGPFHDLIDAAWDTEKFEVVDELRNRAVGACLGSLTERVRRIVVLRYGEGLNASEIAPRLNMTAEAVRAALMRARRFLARCLRKRLNRTDALASHEGWS